MKTLGIIVLFICGLAGVIVIAGSLLRCRHCRKVHGSAEEDKECADKHTLV